MTKEELDEQFEQFLKEVNTAQLINGLALRGRLLQISASLHRGGCVLLLPLILSGRS